MALHEGCVKPPAGGVERHTHSRDASAYDQDVEVLASQAVQGLVAVEGPPGDRGRGVPGDRHQVSLSQSGSHRSVRLPVGFQQ